MDDIFLQFKAWGVIPVVAVEKVEDAAPLADTLVEGGLPCAEVTFRTEAAPEVIASMAKRGDILVGAGTVLRIDQVKTAVDAGARFIVSPGFNAKVARYCVENNLIFTPGVCTPSDIEAALDIGLMVLKYFPAEAFGGLKTLKAMTGPYAAVGFIPTGGINPSNLAEYLAFPKVVACGGTWLAPSAAIAGGRFDAIRKNVREALDIVEAVRSAGT
ncbi:MAG: bifunctional 4-hydroxy-2-oxoglutarate aldolase/2-dehydro-3-deoxy-phosphogluconate aldolase [Desulfobacteraceae bacterium]|nr:bifunctional 4-hydroxy-2-oxoglutarate aldolase/2-dehydro-3-deoxy-phosphogluconate aldolase [Desulfobacteraceae bacterium]